MILYLRAALRGVPASALHRTGGAPGSLRETSSGADPLTLVPTVMLITEWAALRGVPTSALHRTSGAARSPGVSTPPNGRRCRESPGSPPPARTLFRSYDGNTHYRRAALRGVPASARDRTSVAERSLRRQRLPNGRRCRESPASARRAGRSAPRSGGEIGAMSRSLPRAERNLGPRRGSGTFHARSES